MVRPLSDGAFWATIKEDESSTQWTTKKVEAKKIFPLFHRVRGEGVPVVDFCSKKVGIGDKEARKRCRFALNFRRLPSLSGNEELISIVRLPFCCQWQKTHELVINWRDYLTIQKRDSLPCLGLIVNLVGLIILGEMCCLKFGGRQFFYSTTRYLGFYCWVQLP